RAEDVCVIDVQSSLRRVFDSDIIEVAGASCIAGHPTSSFDDNIREHYVTREGHRECGPSRVTSVDGSARISNHSYTIDVGNTDCLIAGATNENGSRTVPR